LGLLELLYQGTSILLRRNLVVMSIVQLTDLPEPKSLNDARNSNRSSALSLRAEHDSRRIRHDYDASHMAASVRPNSAPFTQSMSGAGDIEKMSVMGPKQKELKKEREKNLMSKSTTNLPKGEQGEEHKNISPSPSLQTKKRPSSSISPSRGRVGSPSRTSRVQFDMNDSIDGSVKQSTLEIRKAAQSGLNERDQAALKMGRLVLNTVMGNPDLSTEDSISRFFFDNWLAKSGSSVQQADSYSIELMSHLQAQIAQARADAPFLLNDVPRKENEEEEDEDEVYDEYGNEIKSNNGEGLRGPHVDTGTSTPSKNAGMFKDLSKVLVKSLGEKVVNKTVGAVALEALDRCLIEFGKGNPILYDVKTSLIPLIFAIPEDYDHINAPLTANTPSELNGRKYLPYTTWLEDAQAMFESAQQATKAERKAQGMYASVQHEVKRLDGQLKKEQARMKPLLAEQDALRLARNDQERLRNELAEALELVHSDLKAEARARLELQNELKLAQTALIPKDNMIAELLAVIDQAKRDVLPDIRAEYAASQKETEELKAENSELNAAIQNFKIMLQSQKVHDEKSEQFLELECARIAEKMKTLNDAPVEDLAGEGRVFSAQMSSDQRESERRLTEPLSGFFSNTARAMNGERYVEYLELKDDVSHKEITFQMDQVRNLRVDLEEAKSAVKRVIDAYEEKITTLKQQHKKEVDHLTAKHAEEIDALKVTIDALNVKIKTQKVEIDSLNEEIIRLNTEWKATRIELKRTKESLEEALNDLAKALEKVNVLTAELQVVLDELKVTKGELKDTKEELKDAKEELAQCIIDLREADAKLHLTKELLAGRDNELGMALNDVLFLEKFTRERVLATRLQAQLDFARVEIANLKDNVEMQKHEIHDLNAEIASITLGREQDRKEFEGEKQRLEDIIHSLETSVEQKKRTIALHEARIEYLQATYEEESMNAANAYHRAERHVATLKNIITELEHDIDILTRERNDLIVVRENLKLSLKKMEERAIEAEKCTLGNQNMHDWFEKQLETTIETITTPKDEDAFDDDLGISSVGLRQNLDSQHADKFLHKVPEVFKKKAIDVICRADASMRALADTFTDSIRNLEKSLQVSRDIISKTQYMRDANDARDGGNESSHAAANASFTVTNHTNIMGSPGRREAAMKFQPGQGSMEVLPDGWDMYDISLFKLVNTEEWLTNRELMQMHMNDDYMMHTEKDINFLQHVIDMHGYYNVAAPEASNEVAGEVAKVEEGHLAGSMVSGISDKEVLQDEYTKRILRTAAYAVETENPLRMRVEEQHQEIIVLENTLADMKVDYTEMEGELKGAVRDAEKLAKAKEALEAELATFKERFHQALLAVEEQERIVIQVRKEAVEGFKKKQDVAHPAVKMTMMVEAARGNPKKLVQPFLHFLRRNENDISRQLGQNIIAMREVRALCSRVKSMIDTLVEEERLFYYKKHQNEKDAASLVDTCKRIWETMRASRDDINEFTSWVFEGQDLSLGNDKIRRALKINEEHSYLDPSKAIGDNHLAAAYDIHAKESATGGTKEFPIDDDLKDDVKENAEAVAENLRCDSFRSGGWRMQLHNLDGSIDLDMPVHDWSKDDKISILDAQLQAAKNKIKAENLLALNRLDAIKKEKAESDRKYDEIQDEILALQKEYGAKGIDHDFMVYKRIKKGIIDGSLKKYNLPEVVYSPMDFEDIELGIYEAVQSLIDLCRESGEPEKPQNPFSKKEVAGQVTFDEPDERHGISTGALGAHLSSPVKKRAKSPELRNEDLKADEIGASGMVLHNMALSPIGRGGSAQGARKPTVPVTLVSLPNAEKRSATSGPKSEWRENVEHKKRDKAMAKFRAENQPASFGAYSQLKDIIKRGAPDDSLFFHKEATVQEVVTGSAPAADSEGMPLEWHNQKSQDLVSLLKTAVEKIQMRVLFAKVIKPTQPLTKALIRPSSMPAETKSRDSLNNENVMNRLDTTAELLGSTMQGGLLRVNSLPPPDHQVLGNEDINSDLHSSHSMHSMSQEDMQELFGDMDDSVHSMRSAMDRTENSATKEFVHLPVNAAIQFAKEVFCNGAEPSSEEHERAFDIANNDISRFVSKLNAKVNRHITSAKLFESIVSELESTRQKTGTLDMPTIKRICALRTSLPVGFDEGNAEDMATIMAKLHLAKPPPSIARATHLVRNQFHHLVQEEKTARKFVDGAWGGLPKFERGEPPALARMQELEASTTLLKRSSMDMNRSMSSRESRPFSASNSVIQIDPRFPDPSHFTVSTVELSQMGSTVGAKSKDFYKKKSKKPVLNIALLPTSQKQTQNKKETMEAFRRYQQYLAQVHHHEQQPQEEGGVNPAGAINEEITIPRVDSPAASHGSLDFNDSLAESSALQMNPEEGEPDDDMSYNSHHTYHSRTSLNRAGSKTTLVFPQDLEADYATNTDSMRISATASPLDPKQLVPRPSSPLPPTTTGRR